MLGHAQVKQHMQEELVLATTALSATALLVPLNHRYAQPVRLNIYLARIILALLIVMLIVPSVTAVVIQITDR